MNQHIRTTILAVTCLLVFWDFCPAQDGDPFNSATQGQKTKSPFDNAIPSIQARFEPATAARGQTVLWKLALDVAPGWHTYPTQQTDPNAGTNTNAIRFPPPGDLVFAGELKDPPFLTKSEPAASITDLHYYEGKTTWERPVVVNSRAKPGVKTVKVPVTILVCDESHCLPPKTVTVEATLTISDAPAVAVDAKYKAEVDAAAASPAPSLPETPKTEPARTETTSVQEPLAASDYKATLEGILTQMKPQETAETGLLSFILAGIFWGAVSLVTPCVFPMIPITVSFFLKQSEKEHHRPVLMASVYCLTIVLVLTFAAVVLLSFFRLLSVNPVMNFALGLLFVFFALSLFGMYDIELPNSLARFTSAREGKGGLVGTMFMALTFTIVSFACVAPFLGGFGGTAATSQITWPARILGGLAFSATFAAPFFVLALFPTMLKKLPKSGSWLNSVKVVMGFLELAAALKFSRAGELVLLPVPTLFTYDLVMGMWVALSLLAGLYLLNFYRLPHDSPADNISVPRLLLGFLFLSLGLYLTPALFQNGSTGEKQRPNGTVYAWIDSFLLPEPHEGKGGLEWTGDLKTALDGARGERQRSGERKLVFIDFTGETCTNCKINEQSVFTKGEIKELFQPYKLVQMFTDKVPNKYYPSAARGQFGNDTSRQRSDAAVNLWFQKAAFGTEQLPLYVILEPLPEGKIEIAGVYAEGKINNETAFAEFLKKPIATGVSSRTQVLGK